MEAASIIQKSICQQISELLCHQTDLTDRERVTVMSEYMELFKKSWKEAQKLYKEKVDETNRNEQDGGEQQTAADEDMLEKLENELEEAVVYYEAVLLATTKHRSKADSLSQLLGSATRMALLTANNKRVDLPLRCNLDWPTHLSAPNDSESLKSRLLQCSDALNQNKKEFLEIGQKLNNIKAMDDLS